MDTIQTQITQIEEEIRKTPYHKGTERHIGMLRARLAILRDKVIETQSRKSGGGGGYSVKKQGDATIVLVGPPSAGKSTLLNALTNAESKVAPYSFTTVSVIPGMMRYKEAYIQVLDVPGLIEGAEEGKGRGREVLSVVRGADLLILMSDVTREPAIGRIADALERNGIRIDKKPPKIRIEKHLNGGLTINTNIRQNLERDTIKDIISQMGVKNADVYIEQRINEEELIDSLSKNRVYIPVIKVLNKVDLLKNKKKKEEFLYISAERQEDLERLQEKIWERLGFATIYLVKQGEEPSFNNSMVVKRNMTLHDVSQKIGTEFSEGKTKAKIWGNGSKFPGQEVSLKEKVKEGMQIRFI